MAYRWGEDGLAGWCDQSLTLCLGLALWNGKDPILKEPCETVFKLSRGKKELKTRGKLMEMYEMP